MTNNNMKEHILKTTIFLLQDVYELEEITVRKIAEEANIAVGLINYHFKSKDELLTFAIMIMVEEKTKEQMVFITDKSICAKERLKKSLYTLSDIMFEYKKLTIHMVKHIIISESFEVLNFYTGLISEIMPEIPEIKVKIIAAQIVFPLHVMFLKEDLFYEYINQKVNYSSVIDTVLENLKLT